MVFCSQTKLTPSGDFPFFPTPLPFFPLCVLRVLDKFEKTRYNTSIMVDSYNALQFQWMEAESDTEVYFAYGQNFVNSAFLIVYRFDLPTSGAPSGGGVRGGVVAMRLSA